MLELCLFAHLLAQPAPRGVFPAPPPPAARPAYRPSRGGFIGGWWGGATSTTVIVNSPANATPTPPKEPGPLSINPDFRPAPITPKMIEIPDASPPPESPSKVHLLVARAKAVHAMSAWWIEDGKIHFVTAQHDLGSVALHDIDRPATERLNRQRGLTLTLP
jgi:hypothetical protein